MMYITWSLKTSGLYKLRRDMGVARDKVPAAIDRALSHTGQKTRTLIRRELHKTTGVKYSDVKNHVKGYMDRSTLHTYKIVTDGNYIPLKQFSPEQSSVGVEANPWGHKNTFPHMFILPAMGHVFVRAGNPRIVRKGRYVGKMRQPITKRWGPSLPVEVMRDETAAAFHRAAQVWFSERVHHELSRLLDPS